MLCPHKHILSSRELFFFIYLSMSSDLFVVIFIISYTLYKYDNLLPVFFLLFMRESLFDFGALLINSLFLSIHVTERNENSRGDRV